MDLDDVGAEFESECGNYAHDRDDISWVEAALAGELQDHLGRWPTRRELRAAVQAAAILTKRERPDGPRGRLIISKGARADGTDRWQAMRLELWEELMTAHHVTVRRQ